jgi:Leucine-rich repeat (LRR) protein
MQLLFLSLSDSDYWDAAHCFSDTVTDCDTDVSPLPPTGRLLCSSSLRKLSAGHNHLQKLPERVERPLLEVLDVQHNQLAELPCNLFLKSDR